MIRILFELFFGLSAVFIGIYVAYFTYLGNYAKKPWKLETDVCFQPQVSILIPVHNEEKTIESKLRNIQDVSYPKEKMEVIVADDASHDKTLEKVKEFQERNPDLNIIVVKQNPRAGKSNALNKALPACRNEIVIVSDADTTWPSNMLQVALPYLADPRVGAVSGMGKNINADQSWVTKAEDTYLHYADLSRLGESKIHSTIRFEGGFCAYKTNAFKAFDCETGSDDSGTALEVVQNNYRTILVPEAIFHTQFPTRITGKLKTKVRRANQLICLWAKCFRLMFERRLRLSKRIAILGGVLFILNPVIFLALIITAAAIIVLSPFSLFSLLIVALACGFMLFARSAFSEILFDNLILFYASMSYLIGRRYTAWEKM